MPVCSEHLHLLTHGSFASPAVSLEEITFQLNPSTTENRREDEEGIKLWVQIYGRNFGWQIFIESQRWTLHRLIS